MVFLEDLLGAEDFGKAVNGLAREFREEHELPVIRQLGLVVSSVEAALLDLQAQGIGPFFIQAGSPAFWRERGQERSIRGKMGVTDYKGFQLELLEPLEGSDFYQGSLDPEGGFVVHHLGFIVQDVDEWAGRLAASGSPVWVRGAIEHETTTTNFVYMDTVDEIGIVIEFISL